MIILLSFISLFCSMKSGDIKYNTVVKYSKNVQLGFPDFSLEYTGDRSVNKQFPNGNSIAVKFYDFKVSSASGSKTISWSSGTGDIAPQQFEFDGKEYQLELSYSEKLKTKLSESELVIVKK